MDVEATEIIYGIACDSVETSQELIDLAWQYDITITTIAAKSENAKIKGKDYPGTLYVLGMSGQVSNFQNYLAAMGNKFPSSMIKTVDIQPAEVQGTLDSATLTIVIVCNQ